MHTEYPVSSQMDEAALMWATRMDGGLTPSDETELNSWLAENPAHEWRLAHFRQFYAQLHGTVPKLVADGRVVVDTPVTRHSFRRAHRLIGGMAAAAALLLGAFWFVNRPEAFTTVAAQRQSLTFQDGTHADLNARTSIAIQLHGHDRRVRLEQGEAYFEVAKDPSRPFYVETTAGTVRVTGTKFNVRTDAAGSLEVTVLEGSVAVSTKTNREFHLKPQDQVTVEAGYATEQKLSPNDTDGVIAWREGKIVFDDTPLAVAVERFAAYHGRTLTVAPEVSGLLLGGRYTLDDLDQFVVSLEKTLPVKALRGENGAVSLVATEQAVTPR